jgi:hypothetical protein
MRNREVLSAMWHTSLYMLEECRCRDESSWILVQGVLVLV